jgi:hypothetical protein
MKRLDHWRNLGLHQGAHYVPPHPASRQLGAVRGTLRAIPAIPAKLARLAAPGVGVGAVHRLAAVNSVLQEPAPVAG